MNPINRSTVLNRLQRRLVHSYFITNVFVKFRNQANKIIGYQLAQSPDYLVNGEDVVLPSRAPNINIAIDTGANTGEWIELLLSKINVIQPAVHIFEPGTCAVSVGFITLPS